MFNYNKFYCSFFFICLVSLVLFFFTCVGVNAADVTQQDIAIKSYDTSLAFLGGYSITHPGLGNTKEFVDSLDVVLRYEQKLFSMGHDKWYGGKHSLMLELPFSMILNPDTAPMTGLNFLGSWTFTADERVQPYLLGGGGVVYTSADIKGLGSELNGNWQFGAGLRFMLKGGNQLVLEYRFHHISNLGSKSPNDPLNSSKFLLGIMF